MTSQYPRASQASPPDEPGWWLASDGRWYPPESATGWQAAAPEPAPPAVRAATPSTQPGPPTLDGPPIFVAVGDTATGVSPTMVSPNLTAGSDGGAGGGGGSMSPSWPPPVPPAPQVSAPTSAAAPMNGFAIAALVIGIGALLSSWFVLGGVLGIVAIVLGALGLRKPDGRSMSIVGISLGGVSVIVTVAVVALFALLVNNFNRPFQSSWEADAEIESCITAGRGEVSASGKVTSYAPSASQFRLVIEFRDKRSGKTVTGSTVTKVLEPNDETDFFVVARLDTSIAGLSCSVKEVTAK
jgi:hypothetical protein